MSSRSRFQRLFTPWSFGWVVLVAVFLLHPRAAEARTTYLVQSSGTVASTNGTCSIIIESFEPNVESPGKQLATGTYKVNVPIQSGMSKSALTLKIRDTLTTVLSGDATYTVTLLKSDKVQIFRTANFNTMASGGVPGLTVSAVAFTVPSLGTLGTLALSLLLLLLGVVFVSRRRSASIAT